jgi:endonuclease G
MKAMPKQQTITEKARRFISIHGNDLRDKYGAEGTAVGYKVKNGKYTENVALIFYVKKKKSNEQLRMEGTNMIPKKIKGICTDVVVVEKGFKPK